MPILPRDIHTARGDVVLLALITHPGEKPSILLTVDDVDRSAIPTAEFSMEEAGAFRDVLRELCEAGTQGEGRVRS